MDNISCQIW